MSNETPHKKGRESRSAKHLPEGLVTASYARGSGVLLEHLKTVPEKPGVYRMLSGKGEVLYVGKAKNLKKRVTNYTQRERLTNRIQRMVALVMHLEITITHTEAEALLLEANLIRHHQPPFNVLLRDDKSYPYILITRDHDFPQIQKYRGAKDKKGWYFGPFASAEAVTETTTLLMRAFQLRNCSDDDFKARKRPCLQHHIKRCTAPCVGKVSVENYAAQVKDARDFLNGRNDAILEKLQKEMQARSDAKDFEQAAEIRDRIRVLATIHSKQTINVNGLGDVDVIALHREGGQSCIQIFFFRNDRAYGNRAMFPQHDAEILDGEILSTFLAQFYADKPAPKLILLSHEADEKNLISEALSEKHGHTVEIAVPQRGQKLALIEMALNNAREAFARRMADKKNQNALLEGVGNIFNLPAPPKRIEVYDNSHVSGQFAVGGMIVSGPEGFMKKAYRKFNIKNKELSPGDDYGMMREVLTRRFARALQEYPDRSDAHWPDLILIDGGQGQLNTATETLVALGLSDIPLVGIAKGPDRNAGRERFFMQGRAEFSLPMNDPVLYYLQRLRDEAHRFAIGTHRARRAKAISQSPLDSVAGIGAARKKKLLQHFGSAQSVAKAGIADLMRVSGISEELAKAIYGHFHGG